MVVYGPSVIYMVSQLIRQWIRPGDGVLTFTPAYDAFYKVMEGNQRQMLSCPLDQKRQRLGAGYARQLETQLAQPTCKMMLLCSPQNPTGKVWTRDELTLMAELCERHERAGDQR